MTNWLKHPQIKECAYCGQKFVACTTRKTCSQKCAYAMSLALGVPARMEYKKQRKKRLDKIREQAKQRPVKKPAKRKPKKPPLVIIDRMPKPKGGCYSTALDRPLTTTSVWLIEEFFCKDGYTYEEIAKELHRDPETVNRVIKEILLPDPRIQERLKIDIPKRATLRAARKVGRFHGITETFECGEG